RRRRRKKEEKVGSAKGRKKTPPEEYLDFKPPESPGFRIGVHTHLRDKIEPNPSAPQLIQTEPAIGYRLVEPD
ncbi:MAG: helix-turn-helix domain-containing protein, partial [Limisphaerales bacterium]